MTIASLWTPSSDFYSDWMMMILVLSMVICLVVKRPQVRDSIIGQVFIILGAPVYFITVLNSAGGMIILKDGRDFGFPIWARMYPDASDFLATYIVLGTCYLAAREASRYPLRAIRTMGWIEATGYALLAGFELFLLCRRAWTD